MNKKIGVIFDMDGVLVDTTQANWESFRLILSRYGVNFDQVSIATLKGRSLRDQLKAFNRQFGLNLDYDSFQPEHSRNQEDAWKRTPLVASSGLIELLDELKANQIATGVGTSSIRERALKLLLMVGIRQYFDAIVTEEDVKEHKPDPEIFLEVARRIKMRPEDCVVVEDAIDGVEAAKQAGMKVVALKDSITLNEQFDDADLVVRSFKELSLNVLKDLLS